MAIPRVRNGVAQYLCEWIRIGQVVIGEDYRQPLVDQLCDNKFCMRRCDGGYNVCVAMDDPCYFCIRFGHPQTCRNTYLPLICRRCHKAREPAEKSYPSAPPHFRSQRRMDSDDRAVQAARDNERHDQGYVNLSVETRLANAAVVAATHK